MPSPETITTGSAGAVFCAHTVEANAARAHETIINRWVTTGSLKAGGAGAASGAGKCGGWRASTQAALPANVVTRLTGPSRPTPLLFRVCNAEADAVRVGIRRHFVAMRAAQL